MNEHIALYIHFPFCRRKCLYCSFVSYEKREKDITVYLNALNWELTHRLKNYFITSIYIGGGTPSLLSPTQLGALLSSIHSLYNINIDDNAEITIEVNPGTIDVSYLSTIRQQGFNRLSIGVQSLVDGELALLGRIHTAKEALKAVEFSRKAGFRNTSVDLIYGLPGQSLKSWNKTLTEIIEMNPEHLSLYPLSPEQGTPLKEAIDSGKVPPMDADHAADQYELAEDILIKNGYIHYEISNWAKPGFECQHNLTYWYNLPYMGIGVAAHSYLEGHRFANTLDLDKYFNNFFHNSPVELDIDEPVDTEQKISETIILGLRLCKGINCKDISNQLGLDLLWHYGQQIDTLANLGLLECVDQNIRLTSRGRLLGNEVFWRFLP